MIPKLCKMARGGASLDDGGKIITAIRPALARQPYVVQLAAR